MYSSAVLLVLDGYGIGASDHTNPLRVARTPNLNYIKQNFRAGTLQASGIAVGLPWGETGNSEVGHLTLGAGKILYQHYPRITLSIRNKTFFKNTALLAAFAHAKKNNSAINLIGLLTEGHVHASFDHLEALITAAKEYGVTNLNIHVITDGKDSAPYSAIALIERIKKVCASQNLGHIGSISGRYYALDRDKHYDRTERAYKAMTGQGIKVNSAEDWVKEAYGKKLTDEFIEPRVIDDTHVVRKNEAIIFFNFREDSIRQIAESFIAPNAATPNIHPIENLYIVTFTKYTSKFNVPVAFPEDHVECPLGKILSDEGKTQIRIAETEKYAHITYFFNGLREEPFPNEYRILIPSQNIARHDEHPEMQAVEIASRVAHAVEERAATFILANIANADMIAHTGNWDAALKTMEVVDEAVRKIFDACMAQKVPLLITGDHGNIEQMVDPLTGVIETKHNLSPVPCYLVHENFVSVKNEAETTATEKENTGVLSDIAPTILKLLGIAKPDAMTGSDIMNDLR